MNQKYSGAIVKEVLYSFSKNSRETLSFQENNPVFPLAAMIQ